MNEYQVYENQTLYDVCAHVYGHIDMIMEISVLNGISPTEELMAGKIIKLVDARINPLVKRALENRNIIPATGLSLDLKNYINESGIGIMSIENDFEVA